MASLNSILCTLLVTATVSSLAAAANLYKVGEADGWRVPEQNNSDMYAAWADKYVYHVGDSIGQSIHSILDYLFSNLTI